MRLFSGLGKGFVFLSFALSGVAAAVEPVGSIHVAHAHDRPALIQELLPTGTDFYYERFVGRETQIGEVRDFEFTGIDKGLVLSNGDIRRLNGPNASDYTSDKLSYMNSKDIDFQALNGGGRVRDVATIEFSFTAPYNSNGVDIRYVFGSDEYGEDTENIVEGKRDFMAIFVNGQNCAVTPATFDKPVGVSTINSEVNADLYIANYRDGQSAKGSEFNIEMDGFTKVLTCRAPLKAGELNTVKVGIADASNDSKAGTGNSWLILESITPTFLLDQDGDGIPDVIEGTYDVDGDGVPNVLDLDSDGDGNFDQSECDYGKAQACLSADGDTIPDYLDSDDQGAIGGDGGDSDKDGIADSIECPDHSAGCPDNDANNIPDYNDPDEQACFDNSRAVCRDLDGKGGKDGDAGSNNIQVALDGNGSLDGSLLMVLLAAIGLRLQKKKFCKPRSLATLLSLSVLVFGLSGNVQPAYAKEEVRLNDVYFGAAVGSSQLDPNVTNSTYSLADTNDIAFKLLAGIDIGKSLDLELSYANLGSAIVAMNNSATRSSLNYKAASLSGLFHVLDNRSKSLFVKAGISNIDVDGGVPVDILNDYQLMVGIGGEWALKNDWSLRAEFESFDTDAKIATFGIVKRFKTVGAGVQTTRTKVRAQPKRIAEYILVEEEKKTYSDIRSSTNRNSHSFPVTMAQEDCKELMKRAKNINFKLNSTELTVGAISVLNDVASTLNTCYSTVIEIQAYSDNIGSAEINLTLSEQRAHEVMLQLVTRGISSERLIAKGYGEKNPIATNSTKDGRALNRRVEFQVINDDFQAMKITSGD